MIHHLQIIISWPAHYYKFMEMLPYYNSYCLSKESIMGKCKATHNVPKYFSKPGSYALLSGASMPWHLRATVTLYVEGLVLGACGNASSAFRVVSIESSLLPEALTLQLRLLSNCLLRFPQCTFFVCPCCFVLFQDRCRLFCIFQRSCNHARC